jgi:hypothetical protein
VRKKPDFHPDKLLIISSDYFVNNVLSSLPGNTFTASYKKVKLSIMLAGFPALISSSLPGDLAKFS